MAVEVPEEVVVAQENSPTVVLDDSRDEQNDEIEDHEQVEREMVSLA